MVAFVGLEIYELVRYVSTCQKEVITVKLKAYQFPHGESGTLVQANFRSCLVENGIRVTLKKVAHEGERWDYLRFLIALLLLRSQREVCIKLNNPNPHDARLAFKGPRSQSAPRACY
jgi:hypothetical protein